MGQLIVDPGSSFDDADLVICIILNVSASCKNVTLSTLSSDLDSAPLLLAVWRLDDVKARPYTTLLWVRWDRWFILGKNDIKF